MDFQLSTDSTGAGPKLAYLLHGILGSRRNWASFARALAEARPGWRFVRVDLRGHGDSRGAPGPHTVRACAEDLARLTQTTGTPQVIIGHSFGGKVALEYGRLNPSGVRHLWALDSAIGPGDPNTLGVPQVIETARAMPTPAPDRASVVGWFLDQGCPQLIARWMTTNLRRQPHGGYRWRFELDTIEPLLADYWRVDLWPFLEALPFGITAHILRAERSARWTPEIVSRLTSLPGVHTPLLKDAGHWVQMDNPKGLLAHLLRGFD